MIVNSGMSIQHNSPIAAPIAAAGKTPEARSVKKETKDAVSIAGVENGEGRISGVEKRIREIQDGMTFLRAADETMSRVENVLAHMHALVTEASSDKGDGDGRARARTALDALAETADFVLASARFGGVPVFGDRAETVALWDDVRQSADAVVGPKLRVLCEGGIDVATPEAASAGGLSIKEALAEVRDARSAMQEQADRMGHEALEIAAGMANMPAARTQAADSAVPRSAMDAVRNAMAAAPGASVAAAAAIMPDRVMKLTD